jgi:predicted PurR-regulated permease PerM
MEDAKQLAIQIGMHLWDEHREDVILWAGAGISWLVAHIGPLLVPALEIIGIAIAVIVTAALLAYLANQAAEWLMRKVEAWHARRPRTARVY